MRRHGQADTQDLCILPLSAELAAPRSSGDWRTFAGAGRVDTWKLVLAIAFHTLRDPRIGWGLAGVGKESGGAEDARPSRTDGALVTLYALNPLCFLPLHILPTRV